MTKQKQLLFLVGLLTLASCSRDQAPSTPTDTPTPSVNESASPVAAPKSSLPNGPATLSIDLVRANRADAIEGSVARVYKSGDRRQVLAQAVTDKNGFVSFANIPYGKYDLTFSKAGSAGSELNGVKLEAKQAKMRLKVAQYNARDPYGNPQVPDLVVQTPSATDAEGKPTAWKALSEGSSFNDKITVRAYTSRNASNPRFIMRYVMFSIVSFDKNGQMQEWREGLDILDSGKVTPGKYGNQYTTAVDLKGHGLSGDIYLQVSAMDFNDNRSAQLIPIRLEKTQEAGEVAAPTGVKAVSITLKKQIGYIYNNPSDQIDSQSLGAQAADAKSNLWVNVYWNKPADLDKITGFRVLRADKASGPYTEVAFAPTSVCKKDCLARDYTATLQSNKTYFYKVSAVGSNVATSSEAKTYTLPRFIPELIGPSAEQINVDINPTFKLKADFKKIGATGARLDFELEDNFTSLRWLRIPRMIVSDINGKVSITDAEDNTVYLGENSKGEQVNIASFDANTGLMSFPHEAKQIAKNRSTILLQPNRRYNWYVHAGYAYKLLDDTKAQSDSNPIVAYSVYSDPDRQKLVPNAAGQAQVDIHHFITRP